MLQDPSAGGSAQPSRVPVVRRHRADARVEAERLSRCLPKAEGNTTWLQSSCILLDRARLAGRESCGNRAQTGHSSPAQGSIAPTAPLAAPDCRVPAHGLLHRRLAGCSPVGSAARRLSLRRRTRSRRRAASRSPGEPRPLWTRDQGSLSGAAARARRVRRFGRLGSPARSRRDLRLGDDSGPANGPAVAPADCNRRQALGAELRTEAASACVSIHGFESSRAGSPAR